MIKRDKFRLVSVMLQIAENAVQLQAPKVVWQHLWAPQTTANALIYLITKPNIVCVDVLRPSQPNGVKSSAVSLPNHTLLRRLSPLSG